ncbi:MAG: hypothetical protein MJ154_00195 [Candidatus Saccharibacteria bacterium]|nr:hypothetical protein [Candidatus Saccharibacteria bacterium]
MDQNSNMGGFAPMPGQNGMGSNDTVIMPDGFQQATPTVAPMPGAAPMTNTMPNPAAQTAAPAMAAPTMPSPAMPAPAMPGMPAPNMPIGPAVPASATAGLPAKKDTTLIETIILIVVCLIAAAAIVFAVIFFMQYNELKANYDSDKGLAVAEAVKIQEDADNASFAEREKLPFYSFTGPSDYGSISFQYPKTWNVYVESDGSNNSDFKAYFKPTQVDPIKNKDSRYALRFSILDRQYTSVQSSYESKVKNGKMTSSMFNADENRISGIKYEGEIEKDMNGIVVLIKVNDKTAIFQMDADVYRTDFETLLQGLRRNS